MSHDSAVTHDPAVPTDGRRHSRLLNAALAQLTEGVILADPSGRITFVNEAAARLHGVVRLDVTPLDYADRYHLLTEAGEPYPSAELPLSRAVLRGETVIDARWRIRRPDGTEVVAIGNARPVLGPNGEHLGAVLTLRDITARTRAEAELGASEQRLRDIFEQAPVAIAVLNGPDHVYTVVSPMYAVSPGGGRKLLGLGARDAFPELVGRGYMEAMDEVYRSGVPYAGVERLVPFTHPDGSEENRFFNIGYQPLRDGDGKVYAIASVAYDVTDLVVARQQVDAARIEAERQRSAAEQANAAKSDFLSTMSHELRTPLNAIAGYTQLLTLGLRGSLSEPQLQDIARIGIASNHLMALVTDVLNFARLEAGQVEYQIEDVEFASVIAELEPLLGPQLAAKQLAFDHAGCATDTPDTPHLVRGDREKLRQILLNLLTNAIKFTDDGGRIAIACESDAGSGFVRVRVSDTGRGIPSDQLERIFEPFVQVDRHRTPGSQQGVGLGLAISRDLARGMGGDLTVESTVGVGSVLTLSIPPAGRPTVNG